MHTSLRLAAFVAASICIACDNSTAPVGPPSALHPVTATSFNPVVGTAIAGGVTVKVVDARGNAVIGSRVAFTITAGDGTVSPHIVLSAADGTAHAEWTAGQTAGQNLLLASIDGVDSTTTFSATGIPGTATTVAVAPHILRFPVGTTTGTIFGAIVDQYGNTVSNGATYTSRNTSLVTVNSTTGAVNVVGTGGTTYVVATGSNFSDSTLVIVLTSTDTPCTGITAHSALAVGEVMTTGFFDNGVCVDATSTGGEYAIVPYFNSSVPSAQTAFTLSVFGNIQPSGPLTSARPVGAPLIANAATSATTAAREAFHDRIRATEQQEMSGAAAGARLWYGSAERTAHRATLTTVVPAVGDLKQLNVNPNDFCSNPTMRTGRVAAVTQRAVVMADTANPAGFTDAEYAAFGATFDTLVYSLDVANFGTPTDIDENGGRVILFFTHAVNDIGGGVLGYYYGRDLLPKVGPLGSCPGSNVGEIMYLLVPDPPQYSKSYVVRNTIGTVAHEFQHMINAGRRLYINTSAAPTEERWLNEGLSHIAEELMFYRTSGLTPRQNLGLEVTTAQDSQPFNNYQYNNFARLKEYLRTPESQSPIGVNDNDDDFPTRGAIWSYLRYTADQRFAADEPGFWFKLVNSNVTGLNNLYEVVGADARLVMRDWTLSVFLDDMIPGMNPKYQQLSWNLRAVMGLPVFGGYAPSTFSLPTTGAATGFVLSAGGTIFARFGANANQEVYVRAAGTGGTALPKNVLLALVRTK